jgi:phosphoribosylanthranilate isomerase
MTRVKICGITSVEDAAAAVDAGADALGLVFVRGTPRVIGREMAEQIAAGIPPLVTTVGVFVDQPLEEILSVIARCRLQAVQLHGNEPAALSCEIPVKVIKAIRVRDAADLREIATYPAHAFLLDAFVEGKPGGTGTTIPWDLARQATGRLPVILSGGLRPENVAQAVRAVRPFAVDVSSGVETGPGRKDHRKVRDFIAAVREADRG